MPSSPVLLELILVKSLKMFTGSPCCKQKISNVQHLEAALLKIVM